VFSGIRFSTGLLDFFVGRRLHRVVDLVPQLSEPCQRAPGQVTTTTEVAAGDQVLVGVVCQPALTRAQQLVDLVRPLPVVLGLIEDRQQDVHLVQGVREADSPVQSEVHVAGVAPVGEGVVQRDRGRLHRPAERFEEAVRDLSTTAAWKHRELVSSGIASSASSCRDAHRPLRAVLKTSAMATPSSEDAAYERSLTYWAG
jgi:hypothetical protein